MFIFFFIACSVRMAAPESDKNSLELQWQVEAMGDMQNIW